jgi:hypothetical protein
MATKKIKIEQVTKKPSSYIKEGRIIIPNSFNEYDSHLHQCDKIYYVVCAPCPWINQYVAPVECEQCRFGKAGSYSEGWVKCSYEYEKEILEKENQIKYGLK